MLTTLESLAGAQTGKVSNGEDYLQMCLAPAGE